MNARIDPATLPPIHHPDGVLIQDGSRHDGPQVALVRTLRRTGRKPVRFEGWQLVEAASAMVGRQVWHGLNIYRTLKGGIVVELIVHRPLADQQDVHRVKVFGTLGEAATWLEMYRAADDAPIPAGLGAVDSALPWAVLQAVQLRQCIDRVESDYQALLGEVFAALDITDPADPPAAPDHDGDTPPSDGAH